MANGWTLERREKQSQLIREWKPWQQSIGPVSEEGKAVSAKNALKHGCRSREGLNRCRVLVKSFGKAEKLWSVHDEKLLQYCRLRAVFLFGMAY